MMLASGYLALKRLKYLDIWQQRILGGLSLIVGFCALDLVPNGLWNILTVFYCGTLVGLSRGMVRDEGSPVSNLRSKLRAALYSRIARA